MSSISDSKCEATVSTVSTMEYAPSVKPTKVIQGKVRRLLSSIVHLIPLGMTGLLLWINFAKLYWFPPSGLGSGFLHVDGSDVLNSLQLAAKLYELFVVASLAAITLKSYKRRLVRDGIPFGMLSGAYRVGDVLYLLDSRFWSGWGYARWLALLLIVNTILSILVGPASAILIVPELQWFSLPGAFSNIKPPILLLPSDMMWPTRVNETIWEGREWCVNMGSFYPGCPAAGFSTIYTWASGWTYTGLPENLTFLDPSGSARRRLSMKTDTKSGTIMSSLTEAATMTLGQFTSYLKTSDIGAISHTEKYKLSLASSENYQPLVNTKCNVWNLRDYERSSDIPEFSFPSAELNCFGANDDDYCPRIRNMLSKRAVPEGTGQNMTEAIYSFSFETDEAGSDNTTLSALTFWASLPYQYGANDSIGMRVAACSFMPHWIPSTIVADPSNQDLIESNVTNLAIFGDEGEWIEKHQKAAVGPPILLQESFLPYLSTGQANVPVNGSTGEIFSNVGNLFIALMENAEGGGSFLAPGSSKDDTFSSSGDDTVRLVMEKFAGVIVTDALARIAAEVYPTVVWESASGNGSIFIIDISVTEGPGAVQYQFLPNGTVLDSKQEVYGQMNQTATEYYDSALKKYVTFEFNAEQYGYGYGQPGGSMTFAFTVIFAYVAMVFLYWISVMFRRADTVAAWGDLQDLIALAWSAPTPPDLRGQGANVADKSVWRESVAIRASSSRNVMLAMEIDEQLPGLTRLRKNEGYY
ncbi:hypothetical protein B0J13DRAFT_104804 [Dactylonectria estremocensis]|uniref:Uncharacterized protein n=1 Tax=Dactylonectria estremocensis TaxID=1079267 RepID=A0A9P9ISA2_9HYPO|nr:hypothetical protein B0J13DRAFT_104804 [Dactylonectria estremocensis]